MFPNCTTALRCIQEGQLIYRICNNPAAPHYRRCIRAPVCLQCAIRSTIPSELVKQAEPPEPAAPHKMQQVPEPPSLVRRAFSYAEALARWTAAGKPERPDKEVERIFNERCKRCGWFDPEKQICRGCGCRVANSGFAVLNKIKMATEHCPQDLW